MKRYKTSAIMRAIVADASLPGWQRDAASRVLNGGSRPTWLQLYHRAPYSLALAAGWTVARANGLIPDADAEIKRERAVHDDLVALAKRYRIKPTEDA